MKRAAALGAGLASIVTVAIAVLALLGVSSIPVLEAVLFPGSWVAWVYKGDNYRSGQEFLLHAIAFGVPLNAVIGAILGVLLAAVRPK